MTAVKPKVVSERLRSLDAYRGFVMLAMASGAFSFMSVLKDGNRAPVLDALKGTRFEGWSGAWDVFYRRLCYQFDHVAWTGCSFWDLIQPSFMFMVGVAVPFSMTRRTAEGHSSARWFGHVLFRAFILVLLGIFLSSTSSKLTNFTFVNVLTQIGLGYPILCLLSGFRNRWLLVGAISILAAYWTAFAVYEAPASVQTEISDYIHERRPEKYQKEWEATKQTGFAAHWNMHTNFAAAVDRWFLNKFLRNEEPWREQAFWINDGGYQTLNFIPSLATMIFGLIAGQMLRKEIPPLWKVTRLLVWASICFLLAMAVDTTIWPVQIDGWNWSLCPAVKRIWTPTWAIFSTGWCFTLLAMFYLVIDVWKFRAWAWPFAIVGMNSIAIYCLAQTIKPWLGRMLTVHLKTVDQIASTDFAGWLNSSYAWQSPILMRTAELALLWFIIAWMHRRKIHVRV